jgi:hypothetical protein
MSKRESPFVPIAPTVVLKAVRGNATIITKLYGSADAQRRAREELATIHRAEQLNTNRG